MVMGRGLEYLGLPQPRSRNTAPGMLNHFMSLGLWSRFWTNLGVHNVCPGADYILPSWCSRRVPSHARLRLAHLQVGEQGGQIALGEVPLPE
jgi:hypothetical protein